MKKRYIIFLLLILGIVGMIFVPPVQPAIFVPGEKLVRIAGDFYLTNTMLETLLADVILLAIAYFVVFRPKRTIDDVPGGFYNLFEVFVEGVYGLAESSAGRWTRKVFPWMMTIILLVLVANWMELVPGVDSIGFLRSASEEGVKGAPVVVAGPLAFTAKPGSPFAQGATNDVTFPAEEHPAPGAPESRVGTTSAGCCVVTPFLRAAATDISFTLALALVAMVMTEVFGLQTLGLKYLSKFFTLPIDKMKSNPMAALDPAVGLLEFISEIARVISFTFRLFGNIFAGQVMLFVLTALVPVLVPLGVGLLELFVGAVQAFVFGLLTLAFMTQAMTAHGGEHEEHAEGEHPAEQPHVESAHA